MAGDDIARLILAKGGEGVSDSFQCRANVPCERHFGNCDEQAAVGNVVNRRHLPFRNKTADAVAIRLFPGEINRWGRTVFTAMQFSQPARLAELITQPPSPSLADYAHNFHFTL